MADFKKALTKTLKNEGGYVNDSADKGGETYQGIARNYHSDWSGWLILDQIPNKAFNRTYEELDSYVEDFYKSNFWDAFKLGKVISNQVASFLFDWFVNSGNEAKQVQQVLNDKFDLGLRVDGVLGSNTIAAINAVNPFSLVEALVNARIDYYKQGVKDGWLNEKFLNGLIARSKEYLTLGKSLLVA